MWQIVPSEKALFRGIWSPSSDEYTVRQNSTHGLCNDITFAVLIRLLNNFYLQARENSERNRKCIPVLNSEEVPAVLKYL